MDGPGTGAGCLISGEHSLVATEQQTYGECDLFAYDIAELGKAGNVLPFVIRDRCPGSSLSPTWETGQFGFGTCQAHHGEILQGVFDDAEAGLRPGLVTLPFPSLVTRAVFQQSRRRGVLVSSSHGAKTKATRAAEVTLSLLGRPSQGGYLFLSNKGPVGWGLGSSTSDVVATVRAITAVYGVRLSREDIARLAVAAETASDSVMFGSRAVLFAQRDGRLLEKFATSLPPFDVVGANTDRQHGSIDTVSHPLPLYTSREIMVFGQLREKLRRALRAMDARSVAEVASQSARINNRYLPKPHFRTILRIAEACRALGVQVAHTGSVVGLLYEHNIPANIYWQNEAIARLRELGLTAYRFSNGTGMSK